MSTDLRTVRIATPPRLGASAPSRLAWRVVAVAFAAASISGCGSIKGMAINNVAGTLAKGTGDTFTRDNDPELIRDASAFALKLYEALLESVPKHKDLLIATCGGFTQYGYAFVQTDAIVLGEAHHDEVVTLNERALNLYIRAKDYCLRAMDVRFPGIRAELARDPAAALKRAKKSDVDLLYWTAASWGSAIALGVDKPDLVIDLPTVRALAERALALDETWSNAAIHEMMISLDSLPEAIGGSAARAREHFKRAVEIQQGKSPGPYVALALGVSVPAQNVEEFKKLLGEALAIDPKANPSIQLVTLITQRRARALMDQIDLLFVKSVAS
ncbi:MAG: TRAP transporter TatT component family protein [Acidobacteriota bacterium]